eukprot:c28959_g2_i1 orf=537-836(-)
MLLVARPLPPAMAKTSPPPTFLLLTDSPVLNAMSLQPIVLQNNSNTPILTYDLNATTPKLALIKCNTPVLAGVPWCNHCRASQQQVYHATSLNQIYNAL